MTRPKLPPRLSEFDTDEERAHYEATERGEFVPVGPHRERAAFWCQVAANTHAQRGRICLSLPRDDLARLEALARKQGRSPQALVTRLIQRYVNKAG